MKASVAAGVVVLQVAALWMGTGSARAQAMAVTDLTNFAQNLVTAIEAVDQTLQMIQQTKNQLAQYEEMVRNGAAPAVYTWDKLNSIHNRLQQIGAYLSNYRHFVRDLDDYLQRFGDLDYYRGARCYGSDLSCPAREWERILQQAQQMHGLGAEARKKTLDSLMRSLQLSEEDLSQEATNLERLQQQAQTAEGHMQALQAGNQLASAQAMQLMQIRSVMVAQYRALATDAQYRYTVQVQERAASERYRRRTEQKSDKTDLPAWPDDARMEWEGW